MPELTFLCVRSNGSVPSMEVHGCESDADAHRMADALLAEHSSCDVVEVWNGDRWLFSVGATSQQACQSARG